MALILDEKSGRMRDVVAGEDWAYHGTRKKHLRSIARHGLEPREQPACHADEDRCTTDAVIFFLPHEDQARTWGDAVVRFPWPEEVYDDAYEGYFSYRWVSPDDIQVKYRGKWVPIRKVVRQ